MVVEGGALPPYAEVDSSDSVRDALSRFGVAHPCPVVVSVGGAGGMSAQDQALVEDVVLDHLIPSLKRHSAAAVDGGTDAGVMRMLGRARVAGKGRFPLIGVAAKGTVRLPGVRPVIPDPADLEPGHTGVLIVPGDQWGDESRWIADVAGQLAGPRPSLTLVINGGAITYRDVEHSVDAGRPVLVLSGTGRTADAVAAAAAGRGISDREAVRLAASPLVNIIPLADPGALVKAIDAVLG